MYMLHNDKEKKKKDPYSSMIHILVQTFLLCKMYTTTMGATTKLFMYTQPKPKV